jgi:hypothetical protein
VNWASELAWLIKGGELLSWDLAPDFLPSTEEVDRGAFLGGRCSLPEPFMEMEAGLHAFGRPGKACFAGIMSKEHSLGRRARGDAAAGSSASGGGFCRMGVPVGWRGERSTSLKDSFVAGAPLSTSAWQVARSWRFFLGLASRSSPEALPLGRTRGIDWLGSMASWTSVGRRVGDGGGSTTEGGWGVGARVR